MQNLDFKDFKSSDPVHSLHTIADINQQYVAYNRNSISLKQESPVKNTIIDYPILSKGSLGNKNAAVAQLIVLQETNFQV